MTHPLTPREKVAEIVDPLVFELAAALDNAEGEPAALRRDATEVRDMRMREAFSKADAILTALASGSGDHAELARLAEAATPGPWSAWIKSQTIQIDTRGGDGRLPAIINWPGFDGNDMSRRENGANARFIAAANPATVLALLAENAALRAERDYFDAEFRRQCGATADQMTRATEAERKLAEAMGLVERSIDLMTDEYADTKAYREEARTFISKEAERG